jgi:hypothetical protein
VPIVAALHTYSETHFCLAVDQLGYASVSQVDSAFNVSTLGCITSGLQADMNKTQNSGAVMAVEPVNMGHMAVTWATVGKTSASCSAAPDPDPVVAASETPLAALSIIDASAICPLLWPLDPDEGAFPLAAPLASPLVPLLVVPLLLPLASPEVPLLVPELPLPPDAPLEDEPELTLLAGVPLLHPPKALSASNVKLKVPATPNLGKGFIFRPAIRDTVAKARKR